MGTTGRVGAGVGVGERHNQAASKLCLKMEPARLPGGLGKGGSVRGELEGW